MKPYDCVVIGTGGVGSAALYYLARRGTRVLGLDRFPPGHDRGSSHGDTRIIRLAYFEHPDYVPLLRRAYELWSQLETTCGQQLYREVGLVEVGPPDGEVVPGVLRSTREHNLNVDSLLPSEFSRRFPGFRLPETMSAVFEQKAGYLAVEACVRTYTAEAQKLGAELHSEETILSWQADGNDVTIKTNKGQYSAARLIVTPGAWAPQLLAGLGIRFEIRRKSLFWYEAPPMYSADRNCPAFLYETPAGAFYGFPQADEWGLKVAEHSGGQVIDDPLTVNREIDPHDRKQVENFLAQYLPGVSRSLRKHVTCMYTMSPDSHFIVDRHPQHPQVAFVAGLSGHGFKFASVLGEILAELALDGRSALPIEFLSCRRLRSS
jgi:monomeric sarcosine oxidase